MYIEQDCVLDSIPKREHLDRIAGVIREILDQTSSELEAGQMSRQSMGSIGEQLIHLITYVSELPAPMDDTPIRRGVDTMYGPTSQPCSGSIWNSHNQPTISGQTRGDSSPEVTSFKDFQWVIQEMMSICTGMFSITITKDLSGFRISCAFVPKAIQFDSDVSFSVPDFLSGDEFQECGSYLDSARWSQQKAVQRIPNFLDKLNQEIPKWSTCDKRKDEYRSQYDSGGVTFRIARHQDTVTLGLNQEKEEPETRPVRKISP